MEQMLFRSGDFANLCGTTKDTLRHYHSIGLLEPRKTDSNGYKYYSFMQFLDYQLITSLQDSGCSLSKIKEYLSRPSSGEFRDVIEAQVKHIGRQRRALVYKESFLKDLLTRLDMTESLWGQESIWIEDCKEEYYLERDFSGLDKEDTRKCIKELGDHIRYCRESLALEQMWFSVRIGHDAFMTGDYEKEIWLGNKLLKKHKTPFLHIKPKGKYLTMLRKTSLAEIEEAKALLEMDEPSSHMSDSELSFLNLLDAYAYLRRYARENNLTICGDAYELELSVYSGRFDEEYASFITVQIEDNGEY